MNRCTPLWNEHQLAQAKMIEYAGWQLPLQYRGIALEHQAVRQSAGLFDVSHMGELMVTGPGTAAFLQYVLTRDLGDLAVAARAGRIFYSPMCNGDGGTVDDLLVYPLAADQALLVVNAANTESDAAHLHAQALMWPGAAVAVTDVSAAYAQLALQGPAALAVMLQALARAVPEIAAAQDLRPYHYARLALAGPELAGLDLNLPFDLLLSRTGYTGEDGFEFYLPPPAAPWLWRLLVAAGAEPAGLGARDTLRLEAAMPLYGHELSLTISPLEAGLQRFVNLNKPDFLGRAALLAGVRRRLVGLQLAGRAIPRAGYAVWQADRLIGQVTSGTFSPTLNAGIAMALVDVAADLAAAPLSIEIRQEKHACKVCPLPFISRHP